MSGQGSSGPWLDYQKSNTQTAGPWTDYQNPTAQAAGPWTDYQSQNSSGPWTDYQKPANDGASNGLDVSSPPQRGSAASATSAPPKQGGILSAIEASPPVQQIKAFRDNYNQRVRGDVAAVEGDIAAPVQGPLDKSKHPYIQQDWDNPKNHFPANPLDYGVRMGKTVLDTANELVDRSGVPSAIASTAGRISEAHGGPKADVVGDVGTMLAPFGGEFKALGKMGAQKLSSVAKTAFEPFEKLMSPTTVAPAAGATERIIRRSLGEGDLVKEKAADRLVQHNKLVANLPVAEQRQMISDMENGRRQSNPGLQAAADDLRKTYDHWKAKVLAVLPRSAQPSFITDYYAHMWKEKPSVVGARMNAFSKQGSGRNLKKRSIPTIEDGIKAGLTPKFENPIDATMAYSQNMARYTATHDMLGELKTQGYAKWYSPGSKNIPAGWVPLDGIMTKKMAPGVLAVKAGSNTGQAARAMDRPIHLYAPPEVARVFNNFISKGFEAGDGAPIYEAVRAAANGMTQMKLGLSAYHAANIWNESVISDYARAFRAASRGELGTAAKAMGSGLANTVTGGAKSAMRGLKMQRELLDKQMPDAMSKVVNDAFVRSGGRLNMDPFYRTKASGSFFDSMKRGTFKRDLMNSIKNIKDKPLRGSVEFAGNLIQSTAAPLFEKYIPLVKRGAFASEMEDFLKARPGATQAEIDKEAIKIADSIDNRFGELNTDNLFWSKKAKQASQIALLSPTWNIGTIREIGGGLKDVGMEIASPSAKGEGLSRRAAYVGALAFQTALVSSVYQYLKTGKAPEEPRDFVTPKTGGKDATSRQPERALLPGYHKDVLAFGYNFPHHVLDEVANKENPLVQTVGSLATNKDYRGLPVYRPQGVAPSPDDPSFAAWAAEQASPISLSQLSKGQKTGSKISTPESVLGIRAAPGYMTDPKGTEERRVKYSTQDWKRRKWADGRDAANRK